VESYKPSPCVHCGECCRVSACGFGEWDTDAHQCKFLIPFLEHPEYTLYHCAIFEQIILDPSSYWSPAFGAGCCRDLFNEARERVIKVIKEGFDEEKKG